MRAAIIPQAVVSAVPPNSIMTKPNTVPSIDEYLHERLMPVEGAIPHIPSIEMFGDSIPVGTVGGDLFEYINFQQRYDIDARIQQAQRLSREFLEPLFPGALLRNSVDDQVQWLKTRPGYRPEMETEYRFARSCEQVRVAEELRDLYSTAGVLIVDAQGHGLISAKIASTVHDTFHALMLTELDRYGRTTPMLLENMNLAAGAIGDRPQRIGDHRERRRTRNRHHAIRRGTPRRLFSLCQFRASSPAGVLGGISQVHEYQ